MLKKGDIVVLRIPFGEEPINSHGLVFDEYDGGVQIIFAYGDYCGFSHEECEEWVTKIASTSLIYPFKNVMQLGQDYMRGNFNWLKRVTNSKLDNEKLKKIIFKEQPYTNDLFAGSCDDA